MNAFTRDDFVTWMERLAHVPWPLTLDAFTDLASELGWTFTGYQYSFTTDFAAGQRDMAVLKKQSGRRPIDLLYSGQTRPGRHRPTGRPERFLY